MRIALVITVFNESSVINSVLRGVLKVIKNVFVVNDASTDKTKAKLLKLPVTLINNFTNLGYTKSLEKGIIKAFKTGADFVITFDGDGQHDPTDIKKIIKIIDMYQPDLIIGRRHKKNRFMEEVFGLYSKTKYGFSDPLCGLKAYKKDFFYTYGGRLENKYTIGTEIIFRALRDGVEYFEIPIKSSKRKNVSRFGNQLKGNLLELKAFLNILFT